MNDDLSWNERRELAREQYTKLDKTTTEIAISLSVDEATVRGWINEGGWDGVKRSLLISRKNQVERMFKMIEALNNDAVGEQGAANTRNIEMINKLCNAINTLENEDTVCNVIEVAEQFTNWLLLRDVDFAKKVTVHFNVFIKQKLAA